MTPNRLAALRTVAEGHAEQRPPWRFGARPRYFALGWQLPTAAVEWLIAQGLATVGAGRRGYGRPVELTDAGKNALRDAEVPGT